MKVPLKIITILGARPQFIKAAVLSRLFKGDPSFTEILIHTGQHYDPLMSNIFFRQLQIPNPAYFLNIQGTNHGEMTGKMLMKVEEVLQAEKPEGVLVYGDTNSTLAGALAAAKLHIPLIHVEAGLRSYNRLMPEEINRVLTDHMSQLLFCPTLTATRNLAREGITQDAHHVGDVMYDATLYAKDYLEKENALLLSYEATIKEPYALLTIHRAESTTSSENLAEILDYVESFSQNNQISIIFPVHPRTQKMIHQMKRSMNENIQMLEPLGYFEMQLLLSKARYVLTDSGGLQKEAYFHKVPCITLRNETEWVETITSGWNQLWQGSTQKPQDLSEISDYGKGDAGQKIVNIIRNYFSLPA